VQALAEAGWNDGRNLRPDVRWGPAISNECEGLLKSWSICDLMRCLSAPGRHKGTAARDADHPDHLRRGGGETAARQSRSNSSHVEGWARRLFIVTDAAALSPDTGHEGFLWNELGRSGLREVVIVCADVSLRLTLNKVVASLSEWVAPNVL
jgi:hypothetical protein